LILGYITELIPIGGNGACLSFCDGTCRGTEYRRLFHAAGKFCEHQLRHAFSVL